MRVLVQFRSSPAVHAATLRGEAMPSFAAAAEPIPGLVIDPSYNPVQVPTPRPTSRGPAPTGTPPAVSFSFTPEEATYLVRGASLTTRTSDGPPWPRPPPAPRSWGCSPTR